MDRDKQSQTGGSTGTGAAVAEQVAGQAPERKLYAVENPDSGLQLGYWTMPPPGAKVITTREELFEACVNYTKTDILEALVGLLNF